MDKRRINVRAIIWNDGKLFAVKHKSENGGESSYWCLPGGGLDPFESLEDGITREMIEETGITPQVGRVLFVQQLKSGRKGRDEELEFFFHVTNHQDFQQIDLTTTSHGDIELSRFGFIDPTKEFILPDFLQNVAIENHINTVQPVALYDYLTRQPQ